MKKTILSLVTAAAVGLAGMTAAPQPAHAVVWWVIPAIIGGAVVGAGVGAAASDASHRQYAYEPNGDVDVAPYGCHFFNKRVHGHLRTFRTCD